MPSLLENFLQDHPCNLVVHEADLYELCDLKNCKHISYARNGIPSGNKEPYYTDIKGHYFCASLMQVIFDTFYLA